MKPLGLTITALLFLTAPIVAQSPPSAPPAPGPERLDMLLKAWETRMGSLESFSTRVSRTDVHELTKKTTTMEGEAAFMKPDMARIDLTPQEEIGKKDAEKNYFERLYLKGKYLYEYSPRSKQIIIHEMPKNNPLDENMILTFLKGMKVENAHQRFDLTLTKETDWYGYLLISPKSAADKQEFVRAQLTFWLKNPNPQGKADLTMMPCRLWYKQPNGKEVTYMFSDMQPNAPLAKDSFVPRQIQGYEVKTAGGPNPVAQNPPKSPTVRPQSP
jgi:TIGR03009 family protein